jgi:hypothetical protein
MWWQGMKASKLACRMPSLHSQYDGMRCNKKMRAAGVGLPGESLFLSLLEGLPASSLLL